MTISDDRTLEIIVYPVSCSEDCFSRTVDKNSFCFVDNSILSDPYWFRLKLSTATKTMRGYS